MPVCPRCGKEIHFLKNYVYDCVNEYDFDGEGYHFVDCVEGKAEEYCCPYCGAVLFDNEEDARKFLKGDLETQLKAMGKTEG